MTRLIAALAIVASLASALLPTVADAFTNCTTTCSGYGNYRTCNTYCY